MSSVKTDWNLKTTERDIINKTANGECKQKAFFPASPHFIDSKIKVNGCLKKQPNINFSFAIVNDIYSLINITRR